MPKKTRAPEAERHRFNLDLTHERVRWERAALKLHMKLTAFVKLAVEEKIRRDGLG